MTATDIIQFLMIVVALILAARRPVVVVRLPDEAGRTRTGAPGSHPLPMKVRLVDGEWMTEARFSGEED